MQFTTIIWDTDDDPEGNVQHVAEHGLSREHVDHVLVTATSRGRSKSSGCPAVWGYTPDGRYIMVVYEQVDEATIYVITAFDVPDPYG